MSKVKGKARAKKRKSQQVSKKKQYDNYIKNLLSHIETFESEFLQRLSSKVEKGEDLKFISDMKKILCATSNGVGISACQIGILKNVCVLRINPRINSLRILINPEIVHYSSDKTTATEGCLSYPNVFCPVERHVSIKVKYLDEKFNEKTTSFAGFTSRVIQHEIDHLFGDCSVGDFYRESLLKKEQVIR